jgi:hypothetical protein
MTFLPRIFSPRLVLLLAGAAVLAAYVALIDVKGITSDEGMRLAIVNGGKAYRADQAGPDATWADVLRTNRPNAYQPLYFLLLNTLMRLGQTHDVVALRFVNIGFLALCLAGLSALTRAWRLPPRLFLLGLFAGNAYLFMHVLQIREYVAGLAFYIWSTWLVLRLDERPLGRAWADAGWFAAYGALLAAGFFLQSWVVFPAIGQGLFLLARRRREPLRFLALLVLAYLVVLSLAWPYLDSHRQKVDVGHWGLDHLSLARELGNGFHLVLAGHLPGTAAFADFLWWWWLAGLALTIAWLAGPRSPAPAVRRDVLLPVLCSAVPLAFQIVYFIKVDTLALWPRYFIIHYFFLTWLLALGFKHLDDRRAAAPANRGLAVVTVALLALVGCSAAWQARSFQRDPYLDTSQSRDSNWRTLAAEVARAGRPDDVLLLRDYIVRSTLTFTRPFPNRLVLLDDLGTADLAGATRILYVETPGGLPLRAEVTARLAARGFAAREEVPVYCADGRTPAPDWHLLAFRRP